MADSKRESDILLRPRGAEGPSGPPCGVFDAVVVGSGFGGVFAAYPLVRAGMRVLMLERGDWVARDRDETPWTLSWSERPEFSVDAPYLREGDRSTEIGGFHCVGGCSVVYGAVSLRLRESDFREDDEIAVDVRWPFDYEHLRPFYDAAERLLGVQGGCSGDTTDPPRLQPLTRTGMPLSRTSRVLRDAAARLGLHPFRLPLAINQVENGRQACTSCGICDGFPCHVGAKNDLATVLVPALVRDGMELRTHATAVRIRTGGANRAEAVECVDTRSGAAFEVRGHRVIVAAGALATPHLLLASALDRLNPAGGLVGAHLMRHCNGVVLGAATGTAGHAGEFRKQIGIHDFYHGDPEGDAPPGKLGAIQQLRATRIGLAQAPIPHFVKRTLFPHAERVLALMVMAEDQPLATNRVDLVPGRRDRFGRPVARLRHRHSARDLAARGALADRADRILRETGAAFTLRFPMGTFSHALGTVRMGDDPERYPVAPDGRLRGVENVWVSDGSVFPRSSAVNPSLTIAANALRIGAGIAGGRSGGGARAKGGRHPGSRLAGRPAWTGRGAPPAEPVERAEPVETPTERSESWTGSSSPA